METAKKTTPKLTTVVRRAVVIGFVAGVIWLLGLRVLLYNPPITHYHANFALYVNGSKQTLADPTYYEEITSCSTTNTMEPKTRVHLHDNNPNLVHIHDDAATWGHFFANLGMTLGNSLLRTREGLLLDGQNGNELTFMLNGEVVPTLANRLIQSEDVLLISYGTEKPAELKAYYDAIPKTAKESNSKPDPGSCSGPSNYSVLDRLKKSLDITK